MVHGSHKRRASALFCALGITAALVGLSSPALGKTYADGRSYTPIFRVYNPNSGEHVYTKDMNEKNTLVRIGWRDEGGAWNIPDGDDADHVPVYRVYNPNNGDHHYTTSWNEIQTLTPLGWRYEGCVFKSADPSYGAKPIYRVYNPNCRGAGSHHYTRSWNEVSTLVPLGWRYEGVGWYEVDSAFDSQGKVWRRPTTTDAPVYADRWDNPAPAFDLPGPTEVKPMSTPYADVVVCKTCKTYLYTPEQWNAHVDAAVAKGDFTHTKFTRILQHERYQCNGCDKYFYDKEMDSHVNEILRAYDRGEITWDEVSRHGTCITCPEAEWIESDTYSQRQIGSKKIVDSPAGWYTPDVPEDTTEDDS